MIDKPIRISNFLDPSRERKFDVQVINGSVYVDIELKGGYEYAEVLTQRYDPSSGVYGYDARREFKGIICDSTRFHETLRGLELKGFFFKKQVLPFL